MFDIPQLKMAWKTDVGLGGFEDSRKKINTLDPLTPRILESIIQVINRKNTCFYIVGNIMIRKIVSGGQTGADQAALDVAIEMGIGHGGWITKGRRTEDGRLPDKYRLKEIDSIDYEQRTELNVVDSDGTVIFSHGELKGGSAYTLELAKKHNRTCLHINLDELSEYKAVEIIKTWIEARGIEILNVAGPRKSEDPLIYENVRNVLKSVLYPPPESITIKFPQTVQEAVDLLINYIPMSEKTNIARMEEHELISLNLTLGNHIKTRFGLLLGNEALMQSCRYIIKKYEIDKDDVSSAIIKELWIRLKKTHALRIVK